MERYEVFGIFFSYAIVMFTLLLVIFAVRKYILKQDLQREKFTPVINLGAFTFALISQMTWVSTLFQSSSMGVQFGISGPVWYAVTGICPSAIFCILFTQFRKKAPGARTYLQVIYARFGKAAHYTVCTFALLNNFSVMAIVIANGSKVFAAIDDQISFELVWIITVIVAGICASIGNVRQVIPTCICVSIFLFTVTMAITMDIFFTSSNSLLGSLDKVYQSVNEHLNNPASDGINRLSFRITAPLQPAFAKFIVTFAQVVMDQANWEICSVAPPGMASAGILAACFLWLTLPFAFGTATSLGYFALRKDPFENASFTIDTAEASVTVFRTAFGRSGSFLLFTMNAFILVTVCIFQLYSISAIFTYDIYATHLKPFRVCYDSNCCLLCGKTRDEIARPKDKCECLPVIACEMCQHDNDVQLSSSGPVKPVFACRVHADFKNYTIRLETLHGTAILVILGFILPLGILMNYPGVNSVAINSVASVTVTAAVGSVVFALFVSWLTPQAIVISSVLGGTLAAVIWIFLNTVLVLGKVNHITFSEVCFISSAIGIISGFILPIIISFATKRTQNDFGSRSWERLYELNDPLKPWGDRFSRQFSLPSYDPNSYTCPAPEEVEAALRTSQLISFIGGIIFIILTGALWPGLSAIPAQFSIAGFKAWIGLMTTWLGLSCLACITVPFAERLRSNDEGFTIEGPSPEININPTLPTIEYSESSE